MDVAVGGRIFHAIACSAYLREMKGRDVRLFHAVVSGRGFTVI